MTCKCGSLGCIVLQETCERKSEISPQRVINNGVSESRWPLLLLVGGILADQGLGNSPPPHSQRGWWAQNSIFRLYASYQYDQFLKLDQFAKDLMPVTGAGQELDWQKTEWKEYFKLRQIASIGGIPQDL